LRYQRNLYIAEKYINLVGTIPSLTIWVYLHSFSCHCLKNTINVAKFQDNLTLQQFKVIQGHIDLGANGKPCDFLLVINCNCSRICNRFRDIQAKR